MTDLGLETFTTSDPNVRLAARLAVLEKQMAAINTHRDVVFTPIQDTWSIAVEGSNPSTFTFSWTGGRMWMLAGGDGFRNSVGTLQWVFQLNGGAINTPAVAVSAPTANQSIAFPTAMNSLDVSADILPGFNTVSWGPAVVSGAYDYTSAQTLHLRGMIIEWPQA